MNDLYQELFDKLDYITFEIDVLKVFKELNKNPSLFDKKP